MIALKEILGTSRVAGVPTQAHSEMIYIRTAIFDNLRYMCCVANGYGRGQCARVCCVRLVPFCHRNRINSPPVAAAWPRLRYDGMAPQARSTGTWHRRHACMLLVSWH